jgi:hypothetical protein
MCDGVFFSARISSVRSMMFVFCALQSLKHQRNWKTDANYTKDWYDRGKKVFQADKYRKGACTKYVHGHPLSCTDEVSVSGGN